MTETPKYIRHEGKNYILASNAAERMQIAMEDAEKRYVQKVLDADKKQ